MLYLNYIYIYIYIKVRAIEKKKLKKSMWVEAVGRNPIAEAWN